MVFSRKDWDFPWRFVSLPEGWAQLPDFDNSETACDISIYKKQQRGCHLEVLLSRVLKSISCDMPLAYEPRTLSSVIGDGLPSPSLTWKLKMMVSKRSKRNLLFQGAIFRFQVKL